MWGAGALKGRVISEREHQKGKVIPLCKLFKGRVTLLFQIFLMRMDKLPKNTGRILQRRDWKSEYYRLLDLESTQVRHLSKVKRKKVLIGTSNSFHRKPIFVNVILQYFA